jgi:hypothetical protein
LAHDVFISFSHQDKTVADAVCHGLEEAGVRCWIAPRDVGYGKSWDDAIVDAITEAKLVVVIFSAAANASRHVLNEVSTALDTAATVIPFRIDDIRPTGALRLHLGRLHWLDALAPPLERHIDRLIDSAKRILEGDEGRDSQRRQRAEEARHQQQEDESQGAEDQLLTSHQSQRRREEEQNPPQATDERRSQPSEQLRWRHLHPLQGREEEHPPKGIAPVRRSVVLASIIMIIVVSSMVALTLGGVIKLPPWQHASSRPQEPAQPAPFSQQARTAPQPAPSRSTAPTDQESVALPTATTQPPPATPIDDDVRVAFIDEDRLVSSLVPYIPKLKVEKADQKQRVERLVRSFIDSSVRDENNGRFSYIFYTPANTRSGLVLFDLSKFGQDAEKLRQTFYDLTDAAVAVALRHTPELSRAVDTYLQETAAGK